MGKNRISVLALLTLSGCGSCDDGVAADYFEPAEYGTYVFEPEPDIWAPQLLDFGPVDVGSVAARDLEVSNLGRLVLDVHRFDVTGEAFWPVLDAVGSQVSIESRGQVSVPIEFRAIGDAPARETLTIFSNDPDEPAYAVVLVANQDTPCVGGFEPGATVWQVHPGEGAMCWPDVSVSHGDPAEYQYAHVPRALDSGWRPEADNHISFERRSSLCGTDCACRGGGDFTYFQTFVFVPEAARVSQYQVDIRDVDDGARVTVFNDTWPDGITDPGSYARIPGGATADLAPYFVAGQNRIVITHIDDCCSISRIRDVIVTANGDELTRCGGT